MIVLSDFDSVIFTCGRIKKVSIKEKNIFLHHIVNSKPGKQSIQSEKSNTFLGKRIEGGIVKGESYIQVDNAVLT